MPGEIDPFGLPPEEAIKWFRAKGFATGFDWRDVWQQEHSQAFTVAKAMQADILADIRQAVDDALANGTTLAQFRKDLKPTLQRKGWWGIKEETDPVTGEVKEVQLGSPRRLKTIYDTNLRQSHSAGKWGSYQRNKKTRPYIRYVHRFGKIPRPGARPQHQKWHDVVRPVDDPIWDHIMPMNGWGCHCKTQQLSERDLARYGLQVSGEFTLEKTAWTNPRTGQTMAVTAGVDPGFDYNPGKTRFVPGGPTDPGPAPAVASNTKAKPAVKRKEDAKLTPKHWEKHYSERYGSVARQVGYGRAVHERAKAMSWAEVHDAAVEFEKAGVPGFDSATVNMLKLVSRRGSANLAGYFSRSVEGARLLVAHAQQLERRGALPLQDLAHGPSKERLAAAAKWYENLSSKLLDVPAVNWEVHNDPKWRAFIYPRQRNAHLGVEEKSHVWVHEWGHAVEVANAATVRKVRDFRRVREGDAEPRKLSELTGNQNYKPDEVSREDKYWDPYVGKVYRVDDDSSELLSTLCGDLAKGSGGWILEKDPESLYFGLGVLAGY